MANLELLTRGLEDDTAETSLEALRDILKRRLKVAQADIARERESIDYPDELDSALCALENVADYFGLCWDDESD